MADEKNGTKVAQGGKATPEEIQEGLRLLAKKRERDAKIASGEIKGYGYKKMSELSPEAAAKVRLRTKRMTVKNALIIQKAKKAGITVSDKEIDAEIAKDATKK